MQKMTAPQKPKADTRKHIALKIMSFQFLGWLTIAVHAGVFWISCFDNMFLSEEALMSVTSSFAEIIAGLYGITMAGYTFFLSRIDALMTTDTSLDYVVYHVKKKFKVLAWYITVNVSLSLLLSMFIMVFPASNARNYFLYRYFCNEFITFIASSISLILCYSILVINPNCISSEAAKRKKLLSPENGEMGDVSEFISLYRKMVDKCNSLLPQDVLSQLHADKGARFDYIIEILAKRRPDLKALMDDIVKVHRYYQCMVNCDSMTVTQEMCITAQSLLSFLDKIS